MSNELGWNKTFNLVYTEKIRRIEVSIFDGSFPPNSSTINQLNTIVAATAHNKNKTRHPRCKWRNRNVSRSWMKCLVEV